MATGSVRWDVAINVTVADAVDAVFEAIVGCVRGDDNEGGRL